MSNETLYIVVPAYNESEYIATFIENWYPVVETYGDSNSRLVIINDGSKDNTFAIASELKSSYPQLEVLDKPNGGHGDTVLYGYRYAIENGAQWVFQTDSDGQTLPNEFGPFWDARGEYPIVIGVRTKREDGNDRAFVERTLCRILRIVFGVKLDDANAPFRLMQSSILERYIQLLPPHYNLPNAVLTALFVREGERVAFKPITFRPRQGGVNSINIRRIVAIGWQAIGDFIAIRKNVISYERSSRER